MQRAFNVVACLIALHVSTSLARADLIEREFKVTFVSADLVYLNGGRSEGLFSGAKLALYRDDHRIADLEVLHLAEHSAACRFDGLTLAAQIGDIARIAIEAEIKPESTKATTEGHGEPVDEPSSKIVESKSKAGPAAEHPEASGSIAVMYSDWDDHTDSDLDFSQFRVDVDLRVRSLWTPGLSCVLRTSGRQDIRSGSSNRAEAEWQNRIATLSLEYNRDGSRVGMAMGRINPARVGAIGRLDGVSVEYRASGSIKFGVFAGANPQWQYTENRPDLQTYGTYAGYRRGSARALLIDQTVSVVGQYHSRTTSREAILAQGQVTRGRHWHLAHSIEIDINRGWRRDVNAASVNLSTIFAQGRLNLSRSVAATLSYDTRKSYRTYETRDIADSVFDDRVRQGVRGQLDFTLPAGIMLSAGGGVRTVSGESDRTVSVNGAIRKQRLFNEKSSISIQGAAFDGDNADGHSITASLGQGFRQRDWISLGAGLYNYSLAGNESARVNRRIDITARVGLTRTFAINALGQLNGGDDTRGHRLEAGVTAQF